MEDYKVRGIALDEIGIDLIHPFQLLLFLPGQRLWTVLRELNHFLYCPNSAPLYKFIFMFFFLWSMPWGVVRYLGLYRGLLCPHYLKPVE